MSTQFKADMMLVLVTLCWGVSYFMMDLCLEEMDPLTLNAYRFLGAFVIAAALAFKRLKGVTRKTLLYAFFVSLAMVLTYIGATYGVKYTSQSNAGFFCATAVIFAPILTFFIKRIVPDKKLALVVVMCTIGMALMAFDSSFHIASGDWLCLMAGFCYTIAILITEEGVSRDDVDAFQLGVYQLGFTGVWMLILALLLETPVLPQSTACWVSVGFLAIFCTGVAYIAQTIAQKYTSATHVGVIFTLEPVFAAIVAFLFAGERLLPRAYFGAVLMLLSLLIMEVDFKKIFKRGKV
ncbi:MAG: DMT family transporter [Firmicutes bacterium]|nr:DMT family transporter [Bacillota bacterium]MBR0126635.1 DMT family transporter [Bacillota bacterium]